MTMKFSRSILLGLSCLSLCLPVNGLCAAKAAPATKAAPAAKAKAPSKPDPKAKATPAPDTLKSTVMQPHSGFTGEDLASQLDYRLAYLHITTCAPRIKQAVMALAGNQPADFVIEPMAVNANAATNIITIESAETQGSRYSVLQVNPGCDGLYTQTIYWTKSCATVKAEDFPNFADDRTLVRRVMSYRAGPALQLSLMSAGQGCVSVKKEMFR